MNKSIAYSVENGILKTRKKSARRVRRMTRERIKRMLEKIKFKKAADN